jgi:hypothetical protein
MTKEKLLQYGIFPEHVWEFDLSLDDLIDSGFQDEQEFFEDYCLYHEEKPFDNYLFKRWITKTDGEKISVLVWIEEYN